MPRSSYQLNTVERKDMIQSAPRCAIFNSEATKRDFPNITDWWVSYSPEQCLHAAEGYWNDWVKLAHIILERDKQMRGIGGQPHANK